MGTTSNIVEKCVNYLPQYGKCLNDEHCEYSNIASICEGGLNTVPIK